MNAEELLVGAIDVHTHVHLADHSADAGSESYERVVAAFPGAARPQSVDTLREYYSSIGARCVAFGVDTATQSGTPMTPTNDEIAASASSTDGVVIPFASVDPHRGDEGVAEFESVLRTRGVRGLKLHPISQNVSLESPLVQPLLELAETYEVPVIVHTGTTGVGSGSPGGAGLRLELGNPLQVDSAAARFPRVNFVMAHPGYPWDELSVAICQHKRNVSMDLSGWSLKRLSPNLVHHLSRGLRSKVLFGTDYPMVSPRRWVDQFLALGLDKETAEAIMRRNAAELLRLEQ